MKVIFDKKVVMLVITFTFLEIFKLHAYSQM